jgi:hypothetical protein
MPVSAAALRLLNELEKIEMMSLEWGFVDGSLSEDEVIDLAKRFCGDLDVEDVLEELLDAKLIFEFRAAGASERYRSRFAEMTRLLASLRQLFDRKPWQSAPRLVADFRIDRRPRRYPIRDRDPEDILAEHASTLGRSQSRRELWRALMSARPGLLLASFQERYDWFPSQPTEGPSSRLVPAAARPWRSIFPHSCALASRWDPTSGSKPSRYIRASSF